MRRYLKRCGTAEKKNENNVSKECILTLFETADFLCESNVSKTFILTVFEKIGNCRNLLTTMSLKHAL